MKGGRQKAMRRNRAANRRKAAGVIAFFMFFVMLGTVGALEQDLVPFTTGTIRMFAALGLWAFFTWQSGAFD